MQNHSGLRLAVDIGGTFTDTVVVDARNQILASSKTPTTPDDPAIAAVEGVFGALASADVSIAQVTGFVHGTTLATNALIERRGARVATVTTEGFRDILEIAYERRYSQYDINLVKPDLIVPRARAFTIAGRMDAQGHEIRPIDEGQVDRLVGEIKRSGAEAIAVCLMHAYANPAHELHLGTLLQNALPEVVVSLSHDVSPEAREFDRLCTTIANAYIQPLMAGYLADISAHFSGAGLVCPILMMTASGGMTTLETAARLPIRLVESGPAGGAILAARIAQEVDAAQVLSFDMGGTTAKLCLIDNCHPQTARTFEIARAARFVKGSGMPVRIPVIDMIEIGAGGGSIAQVDRLGRILVGPQSAGSEPGPAAFSKGGDEPTVTDADVVQGLIDPVLFAEGRLAIDEGAAKQALLQKVGEPLNLDALQAACGISGIVDESMASAGRMHAVESGKDLGDRLMIAFGGNGPLHATRVARRAQVDRILIPRDPGVGSAVGFLFAPVSYEIVRSFHSSLEALDLDKLNPFFDAMLEEAETIVRSGAPGARILHRRQAFMRYQGQGHEIEIALPDRSLTAEDVSDLRTAFEEAYRRQFSRIVPGMQIEIMNWAVQVSSTVPEMPGYPSPGAPQQAKPVGTRRIFCDLNETSCDAQVYNRAGLSPGHWLEGPALIVEPQTTTFVSADFNARVDGGGNILLCRRKEASK